MSDLTIKQQVEQTVKIEGMIHTLLDPIIKNKSPEETLLIVREKLLNLLDKNNVFKSIGVEPYIARGVICEIMFEKLAQLFLKLESIDGEVITGIQLPIKPWTDNEEDTTQIDAVIVTDYGIICTECKSYYGNITLLEEELKTPNYTASPWRQNEGHIKTLAYNLMYRVDKDLSPTIINSVFLFSIGELTKWEMPEPPKYLILPRGGLQTLKECYNALGRTKLNPESVQAIKYYLKSKKPTAEQSVQHISNLQKYFKSKGETE